MADSQKQLSDAPKSKSNISQAKSSKHGSPLQSPYQQSRSNSKAHISQVGNSQQSIHLPKDPLSPLSNIKPVSVLSHKNQSVAENQQSAENISQKTKNSVIDRNSNLSKQYKTSGGFEGMQNSSSNFKTMSSGIGGIVQPQNNMNKAVTTYKQMQQEQIDIKARIIKLRKEEERAIKRMNDNNRKQEFVNKMNEQKYDKFMTKKNMMTSFQNQEEDNRMKFNQYRNDIKRTINNNRRRVHTMNRETRQTIQKESSRVEQIIKKNKDSHLSDKQQMYISSKAGKFRSKSTAGYHAEQRNQKNIKDYNSRINKQLEQAASVKQQTLALEKEEAEMMARLQMTVRQEKQTANKLKMAQDSSPVINYQKPQYYR